MRIKRGGLPDKIPIDMTPMIDIVFQLLAFFCMTLKVASAEGDFNIKMPLLEQGAGPPDPVQAPVMKVRMTADADGNLLELTMNERTFDGPERFQQLHLAVASQIRDGSLTESWEVELDCDYLLKYEYVIQAITAVTGKVEDGKLIKLVEKVKFAAPRPPPMP